MALPVRGTKRGLFFLESNEGVRKGGEILNSRTDLLGIDGTAQPFSAVLRLSALVLQRESRMGVGEATWGRYEYPIFLRSDQSFRGVADAFFPALVAGYSRGRAALHADGGIIY